MPDVKDSEKKQIRYRAKRLAIDLLESSISTGFILYSQTVDKLYDRSAKWKICLLCGEIDRKANLAEDGHDCAAGIDRLPVIVTTNWAILKKFFLSEEYTSTLRKLGVEGKPIEKIVITSPREIETKVEEAKDLADTQETSA
jgi:hypothetical protein